MGGHVIFVLILSVCTKCFYYSIHVIIKLSVQQKWQTQKLKAYGDSLCFNTFLMCQMVVKFMTVFSEGKSKGMDLEGTYFLSTSFEF